MVRDLQLAGITCLGCVLVSVFGCATNHLAEVQVSSVVGDPIRDAVVAITCTLGAAATGEAVVTDDNGAATVLISDGSLDSREIHSCELTVAKPGKKTEERPIQLCTGEIQDSCRLRIVLRDEEEP